MSLSILEVEQIARLARLKLSPEEIEQYRNQISDILEYAERLQSLDTSAIPPTSSLHSNLSGLREDVPRPSLSTESLMNNAPSSRDDQFLIPPVLG